MDPILLGKGITDDIAVTLLPKLGNRHGLVAGATGTGKTVTLMTLAEGFSRLGVPVFLADVKGDVSGLAVPGTGAENLLQRAAEIGVADYAPAASPTIFWDLYGKLGHPVRTTVSEMGPTLLSRILELNDTQAGVLDIVFKLADDRGLLLLDMDDLRALLGLVAEERKDISTEYGLVSAQSIAAIQRSVLRLAQDGGEHFFGEPALELADIMRVNHDGRGMIGILAADQLVLKPKLYSTFLLWLLSELFEQLPEVGDLDKPKLVFIFDEAHLLFDDAPRALLEKVEQVVRLIRSKGVGIYFVTQNPADIPDTVLAQLGNRIQHALRAYTPSEQKGLKAASQSFRANVAFDTAEAIQALGVGEALVSVLDEKGAPTIVARTKIRPPASRLGPATDAERAAVMAASPVRGLYDQVLNRESAAEILSNRHIADQAEAQAQAQAKARAEADKAAQAQARAQAKAQAQAGRTVATGARRSTRETPMEALTKSVLRTAGSTLTRELMRGILGGLKRR